MLSTISKYRNSLVAFMIDTSMIPLAWLSAFWLFYNLHSIPLLIIRQQLIWLLPVIILQGAVFWLFGLYRGVWRFASIPDLIRITKAVGFGTLCLLTMFYFFKAASLLPRVILVLYPLLLGCGLAGARIVFRWLKDYQHFFRNSQRVLIVGAGYAGERLIRDLLRHENHLYQPIVLVDDNPAKVGKDIHGVRVAGTCNDIPTLVGKLRIELILIAIPSAASAQMRRVVSLCELTKVTFRTLPSINDLACGRVGIELFRNVSVEDLLGRDQVNLDWHGIKQYIKNKVVLVSGGGGSIGSELCRQIALLDLKSLIIVDNCEFNLYSIDIELRKNNPNLSLYPILIDVTDRPGIQQVFINYKPDIVFHAAAYKHVPLLETQGRVAIHNNVIGTSILANISAQYGVDKFILISTDKAVNPTNLMGKTKRAAEIICQNLYESSATQFITVRFGNVLDSAGSVMPLFRKQIREGGPLTITHPEISRYFMSIPEAAQLIMQAALLGQGSEIYVLEMGEPIKIKYLAEQMIKLAGKKLGHDIEIVYTGLRPGEKLYEELFYANEELHPTAHHKILLAKAYKMDKALLNTVLTKMEVAFYQNDDVELYDSLMQLMSDNKSKLAGWKENEKLPTVLPSAVKPKSIVMEHSIN